MGGNEYLDPVDSQGAVAMITMSHHPGQALFSTPCVLNLGVAGGKWPSLASRYRGGRAQKFGEEGVISQVGSLVHVRLWHVDSASPWWPSFLSLHHAPPQHPQTPVTWGDLLDPCSRVMEDVSFRGNCVGGIQELSV